MSQPIETLLGTKDKIVEKFFENNYILLQYLKWERSTPKIEILCGVCDESKTDK